MNFEELVKSLGLEGDDSKDKVAILKKEYNARQKELKTLNDNIAKLNEDIEANKVIASRFNTVVTAFGLDVEATDFDSNIETAKEKLIKDAGVDKVPDEEIKALKTKLTKAERENKNYAEQVSTLSEQLKAEQTQRVDRVKRDAIHKAVLKNNIIDPETSIDLFLGLTKVEEDGKTVTMMMSDGTELPVHDGIADWAKEHPKYVEKKPVGGMGSNGGSSNSANSDVSPFMQSLIKDKADNRNINSNSGQSLGSVFG